MAATTVRWACVSRIFDLAAEHEALRADDCTVEPIWPGDRAGVECVYVSDVDGELNVPVSRADGEPVTYDDQFTITIAFDVNSNGRDNAETMERIEEMVGAVREVVAAQSQLGRNIAGVITARLGAQHGPWGWEIKGVGLAAHAQLDVEVTARSEGAPA